MLDRLSTFDRQTLNVSPTKVKYTLTINQFYIKKIRYVTPIFLSKQPQGVCDAKKKQKKNKQKTTNSLRSKFWYII